ncbi:MAG: hypothetical protein AAB804_01800 [Patescibacteria group bacterium]
MNTSQHFVPQLANDLETLGILIYRVASLGVRLGIEIANRRLYRIPTHLCFLLEASCDVDREIARVLIGHTELDTHQQHVVLGVVAALI